MKRLITFFLAVLDESGARCGVSTLYDRKTVIERVENEGLSFLTITLPAFCAEFEKALSIGKVESTSFSSFRKRRCLPEFLQGFMCLIFSTTDGSLLPIPNKQAILCIRQVCLIYKKLDIECTQKRIDNAMFKYMECEKDIKQNDSAYIGSELQDQFRQSAALLFRDFFCSIENQLYADKLVPRHSSGSTADKLVGNDKYRQLEWPARLHSILPWESALLPAPRYSYESYPVSILEPGQERPVRIVPVPKTQKTPRLIAMEPTCMQYVQQGLLKLIDQEGPKSRNYWAFCQNKDQTFNQGMAKQGSEDGSLATLDLSDASDRVSYQHVRDLLHSHPLLLEYVDACRSRKAAVPGFGVIRLSKYASMGSALCFPFEAMVFATVALMGVAYSQGTVCSSSFIKRMKGRVRVYGDDIIVPTGSAITVKSLLEAFGFKVNSSKSFWTGKFRESCGKEYYDGFDVSVVRAKSLFPEGRRNVHELVKTVELHNALFSAGWFESAAYVKDILKSYKLSEVPVGTSSVIGLYSYQPDMTVRWDKNLHKPLVRAHRQIDEVPSRGIDEHLALLKFFLERQDNIHDLLGHELYQPLPKRSFTHSGRPRTAHIKTGYYEIR